VSGDHDVAVIVTRAPTQGVDGLTSLLGDDLTKPKKYMGDLAALR